MDKDKFPAECRGCYANCYACTKEKNGHRLPELRQLAARRKLKVQAIVCGHWHASYGHTVYEKKGSEFGPDANFQPYYGNGIIALDACTVVSGFVNCIIIDD